MLSQRNRLRKQNDFDRVFKSRSGAQSPKLSLKAAENGSDQTRFGLVISAKTAKKAVDRNRVRRQMSEVVRKNLSSIKAGYDLVLIAKPGLVNMDYLEIEAEIKKALEKAGLW